MINPIELNISLGHAKIQLMSPEFNFLLKLKAKDDAEAENLREFINRIIGVVQIKAADPESRGRRLVLMVEGKNPSYGDVIRSWRLYRELEPSELANNAEITQPYLSQIEHDKIKRPSESRLAKIARALNVDYDILLTKKLPPAEE